VKPRSTGVKTFAACTAFRAAVVIPLLFAGALQGTTNNVKDIDIVVKKKPGGAIVAHQKTDDSGTFRFDNLPAGSYTIEASPPATGTETSPATAAQRSTPNISLNATVTFEQGDIRSPNARSKAAAPSVRGPRVEHGTMHPQIKGMTQGRLFSEDFTITGGAATITGIFKPYDSGSPVAISTPGGTTAGRKAGGNPGDDAKVNSELENAASNQEAQTALATSGATGVTCAAPLVLIDGICCPAGSVVRDGKCWNGIEGQSSALNTSRSNTKNNLVLPLNVTGATCNGTGSVSVTTNYAPPQGSLWVFSDSTSRKVIATIDQPTPQAANTFQFAVDASKGISLVIENSLASSLISPYAITCGPSAPLAGNGNPEPTGANARAVTTQGISGKRSESAPIAALSAQVPAACPNLSFTQSSRTNAVNPPVAEASLVLTNNGPGNAVGVTVTGISCGAGFAYAPRNGQLTLPFVVPGAGNLPPHATVEFSALFHKAELTQTGSFPCGITYTEGKSCPSRTATVNIH
jgi:hypothetical protein